MMHKFYPSKILCSLLFVTALSAQNLEISTLNPNQNQNNVNRDVDIVIEFDQNINSITLNDSSIVIRGSQSGKLPGIFSGGGTSVVTFNPDNHFRPGEIISVTITTALLSETDVRLARGFTYSFTCITNQAPATPLTLAQRNLSSASTQGRDIKVLDIGADGDLDILTGSEGVPEQLVIYENDGNMNFCTSNTGGNFRNVEVYDIDGDGDFDNFGATGSFDTELNWFENEGTVPFTERFISSEDPWTLAGGDLDSDGDIDVVAAVLLPNRLLFFANDGHGNFSYAKSIPTTFSGGSDSYFYIRDINSDGAMDILGFHRDAYNLVWYENDGTENFTEHLVAHTSNRMRLASADMDDDGDMDIVSVSTDISAASPVSWYENDGSENFTEHPITTTTTNRLFTVSITDLDGDQDMDILAGGYWFENDGSQNFSEQIISTGLASGTNYIANGISYADMDEDGDMDIVALGFYTVSWIENTGFMNVTSTIPLNAVTQAPTSGEISISFDQPIDGASVNSNSVTVFSKRRGWINGDFSGAGTNTITFDPSADFYPGDIIEVSVNDRVRSTFGHRLAYSYGFSFQVQTFSAALPDFLPHSINTHTSNVVGLDVADIDGDGDLDLVSCSWSELYWYDNDGDGSFTTIPITTSGTPVGVFAFDQNGDGSTDIWIDNDGYGSSMIYTNDGSQNFTQESFTGYLRVKQVTDINHDGDLDLLYTTYPDKWTRWIEKYYCGGYGGLGYVPNLNTNDVQAGDMDNDGDTDFIAASAAGPVYFENNSHFIFTTTSFDNNNTNSVYLSDLDGDGDLDPVFTVNYSAVVWYENRLTGDSMDFGERQEVAPLNQDPRDVITTDIDGDGDADIAAVSRNDDKVVWYENRLNESFADFGPEQLGRTSADGPVKIQSADLDGDGDMDLVTISEGDDELMWFENRGISAAVDRQERIIPDRYALYQNYPNPFNPSTNIKFTLGSREKVTLEVYNMRGQKICTLLSREMSSGSYEIQFDATNLSSGIYYYTIKTDRFRDTKKMLLIM